MPRGEIRDGSPLARVRSLCLGLPGTEERESHGEPCWFAGGRKTFVMELVEDGWRSVAPKRLVAQLDAS